MHQIKIWKRKFNDNDNNNNNNDNDNNNNKTVWSLISVTIIWYVTDKEDEISDIDKAR